MLNDENEAKLPTSNGTALPIDVTHFTPFGTVEQALGSYIPPAGAPGFDSRSKGAQIHTTDPIDDIRGTKLAGRRQGTDAILSAADADKVGRTLLFTLKILIYRSCERSYRLDRSSLEPGHYFVRRPCRIAGTDSLSLPGSARERHWLHCIA